MNSSDVDAVFLELGRALQRDWSLCGYAEEAFPGLALDHLTNGNLSGRISSDAIVDWALSQNELPAQAEVGGDFGQPPITMFDARRFHIDALFWLDGTTAIHQHAFCGAFQVLVGSSIQTRYQFHAERSVNSAFLLGRLSALDSELLRVGDARAIKGGSALIHSLFHLDRPSVSIVVRTRGEAIFRPQYTYQPPGVAFDPKGKEPRQILLERLTHLLVALNDPSMEKRLGPIIANEDLHTVFLVLRAARALPDQRVLRNLMNRLVERDSPLAPLFEKALEEERRAERLIRLRSQVTDAEGRFLLAVLLNAADLTGALSLYRQHRPQDDAILMLIRAIANLAAVTLPLQAGAEPWQLNVLGLPPAPTGWEDALRREWTADPSASAPASSDPLVLSYLERMRRSPALGRLFAMPASALG